MINFLKGIIVGIGGIAPGLSGSVLLVIFGLYQKTISSIGSLFKNLKENLAFLIPLFLGFGIGVLLFSKIVNFLLINYEVYTRFTFLGLILGTVPLFYKEVKKEGFSRKYYSVIILSALLGFLLFHFNKNLFPVIKNPNLVQSIFLGVAVAGSSIIPGVDSAVILSSLGLYELYVSSIANLNFTILIPAGFGLVIGIIIISYIMNRILKKYYTITFSIIFGLFISIIPNVLSENCILAFNINSVISIILLIISFLISYFLGNIEDNILKLKKIIKYFRKTISIEQSENAKTK